MFNLGPPFVGKPQFFLPVFQLMEDTKKACGKALHSFTNALLNYRANTSKVDMRLIQSHLEQWKSTMVEREQTEEYLRQQYLEKHDGPRTNAKQKYMEYLQNKNEKFYQWLRTKNHGDLFQWLEMDYKEDATPMGDPVYTKYSM